MYHINECFILINVLKDDKHSSIVMIIIWQMTNTPPKTWLMNTRLVLASKIHHTPNKTHAKSLNFLTSIAARTKNNKAIKIFLLTSSARCRVFSVSIETVPKTHRPTVRET